MATTAFPTWEAFYAFFEEYQRDTFQVFVIKTSTSIATRNQRVIEHFSASERGLRDYSYRLIPEEFKVYTRTLVCTHSGKPRGRQSQGLRLKQKSRAMECPAKINLLVKRKRDDSGWHVVVTTQVTSHNHPLDAANFMLHPRNRKVEDPMVLEAVNALRKAGVKRQKIRNYLEEKEPSKHVTRSDVNNLLARMKNGTDFISNALASKPPTPPSVTQVDATESVVAQGEPTQSVATAHIENSHSGNDHTPGAASFSLRDERQQPVSQPSTQQNNDDVVTDANSIKETAHVGSGIFKLRVKRLEEQNMALFKQNNTLIQQNRQYLTELKQLSNDKNAQLMELRRSQSSLKATVRELTEEVTSLKEENARLNMLHRIQSDEVHSAETEDKPLVSSEANTVQPAKRSLPVDISGSDGAIEFVIRSQKRSK
ncbi:hypothetical protein DVH05_028535 [Phytophthora capsici]|nr:hypothetical protein DVH05_028535 [Phytophthora capsici]